MRAILSPQEAAKLQISQQVFSGKILIFDSIVQLKKLIRITRKLLKNTFDTNNPCYAHDIMRKKEFFRKAAEAQKKFNTSKEIIEIFPKIFQEIGLNNSTLYLDTPRLRIAPPIGTHDGGECSHIKVHRDTWGVAIQEQINWWAPIYPLSKIRTIGFFPKHWDVPLQNNTKSWSFRMYIASKRDTMIGKASDYPSAPTCLERLPISPEPMVLKVNQLMSFSAAHAHCSIPNKSKLTRFSIEVRTVDEEDMNTGRYAPNIDCESSPPLHGLFHHSISGEKLKSNS